MKKMKKSAQSLIEYGLILALVAVVAVGVMGKFGKNIGDIGTKSSTQLMSSSEASLKASCTSGGGTWTAAGTAGTLGSCSNP